MYGARYGVVSGGATGAAFDRYVNAVECTSPVIRNTKESMIGVSISQIIGKRIVDLEDRTHAMRVGPCWVSGSPR
jgi:hypothetical protein